MKPFFKYFSFLVLFWMVGCRSSSDVVPNTPSTPTASDNFITPNTEDIVMYEVNFSAFSSSGNLQGVTNNLDRIKSLGANTVWLMPNYPVGILKAFGSPYCVRDFTAVNTSLGTLDDLKNLVKTAHQKNMAVILDWVGNHTSWDNAWISQHPDWYTRDSSGNIISPAGTGWNDVADLNYDNQAMRTAMIAAMKFWIDNANIDGFRCDAADFVPKDFWTQALTSLQNGTTKKLIFLAEGSRSDHFSAGFQMNFSWDFFTTLKNVFKQNQSAATIFTTNTNEYAVVPAGKQKLRFITNHDETAQASPATVYGSQNAAIAAEVIATYLQGVPLLYNGQEVGNPNTISITGTTAINWTQNPQILSQYNSFLNFYSTSNAAKKGTLTTFSDADICAFQKIYNSDNIAILVNTRNSQKNYTVPSAIQGNWTNISDGSTVNLGTNIALTAYQYLILKK